MADIPIIVVDIYHVDYVFFQCFYWTLCPTFSLKTSDIMSNGAQNVGHVRMSDDFSYTLQGGTSSVSCTSIFSLISILLGFPFKVSFEDRVSFLFQLVFPFLILKISD